MNTFWFPRRVPPAGASGSDRQVSIVMDEPHNLGSGDRVRLRQGDGQVLDGIADDITDSFSVTIKDIQHVGDTAATIDTSDLTLEYDVAQKGNVSIFPEGERDAPNFWSAGRETFVDDYDPVALFEQLSSQNNALPPADLRGLVELPGSVYAGVRGRSLHMSRPGLPGAWPAAFTRTYPHRTVAVQPSGSYAIVLTDAEPFVVSGFQDSPAAARGIRLEVPWACVSEESVVTLRGSVYWASSIGLCRYSAAEGPGVATTGLFHWKEWLDDVDPAHVRCAPWNGMVVVYAPGAGTFMFDDSERQPHRARLVASARAMHYDRFTGGLHMLNTDPMQVAPAGHIRGDLRIALDVHKSNKVLDSVQFNARAVGNIVLPGLVRTPAGG